MYKSCIWQWYFLWYNRECWYEEAIPQTERKEEFQIFESSGSTVNEHFSSFNTLLNSTYEDSGPLMVMP